MTCLGYIPLKLWFYAFFVYSFLEDLLIWALVRMRALQDRCIANEGVIRQYRKRQEIENKERDQYKEAVCILNEELKPS